MSTQPALKLALLFMAGILIAPYVKCPFPVLLGAQILFISFAVVFLMSKTGYPAQFYIGITIVVMGAARFIMTEDSMHPNHVNQHLEQPGTIIQGALIKDPVIKSNKIEYWINVEYLKMNDSTFSAHGRILLSEYDSSETDLRYGEVVLARGMLEKPKGRRNPGGFNYRAYLKTRGIDALFRMEKHTTLLSTGSSCGNPILKHAVYPVRRRIASAISKAYEGRAEALLRALMIGDRTGIDPEMREVFSRVGIIHVLAVSGLHVGYILLIITGLLKLIKLPASVKTGLTIVGLVFFALLTEANAPVVRATIMTCLYLIGKLLDRDRDVFNIVGLAAFVILMMQPRFLFDAGFQLSFSAVLSIVYLYRRFQAYAWMKTVNRKIVRLKPVHYAWSLLLVSISAQLGTIMITARHFNRISVSGVFANLFAIPLIGVIIPMECVHLFLLPVHLGIASVTAHVNSFLIKLLFSLTETVGNVSWVAFHVPTPHPMTVGLFIAGVLILFHFNDRPLRSRMILVFLLLLNGLAWREALNSRAGLLTYAQLDVGQGDAAVIHLPHGRTVLIDGGPATPTYDAGERVVAPYLHHCGVRTLDAVILTHEHSDHVGGLSAILKHFNVRELILSDSSSDSLVFRECLNAAHKKNIFIRLTVAPDSLILPGVKFYFISPDSVFCNDKNHNNQSIVTLLCFGKRRMLLTGDAERPVEEHLLQTILPLDADLLKVGHHGSRTSSSEDFLNRVDPEIAIVSVGYRNRFRHPSPKVIHRHQMLNIPLLRTDQDGAILCRSDGQTLERTLWK